MEMRPAKDYVRLAMLCDARQQQTLVEMLMVALRGERPSQCDDFAEPPEFFVEGSAEWRGGTVRVRLFLVRMDDQIILVTARRDYRGSLSHETIARDIADHFWTIVEAQGLHLGGKQ